MPSPSPDERQGIGPLAGYLVVDLTRALAGPHAGMMLGDLGARVIKVESPDGGDDTRGWGPPFVGSEDDPVSTYFLSCNRNKESVTADLKTEDGRMFLTQLVERADVLLENFRPGVLDRLGFATDQLHELDPRLVVLSITGFGHDGPEGGRAGYDQIAQGEAGLMSITGEPGQPTRVGVPIADLLAGMYGVSGVLAALLDRERTVAGRSYVRACLPPSLAYTPSRARRGRWRDRCRGRRATTTRRSRPTGCSTPPTDLCRSSVGSESQWRTFAPIVGLDPQDSRFATNRDRVAHRDELVAAIEETFTAAPAVHWLDLLAAAGIPSGKVRSIDEVYEWEQTRSQGLLVDVDHPTLGRIQLPGPPLRFDDGGRAEHDAPPTLGAHDQSVRAWLESRDL